MPTDRGVAGSVNIVLEAVRVIVHRQEAALRRFGAAQAPDVLCKEMLVGCPDPFRQPRKLTGTERVHLEVHIKVIAGPVGAGQAEPHEPVHRGRQAAVRTRPLAEPKRAAQLLCVEANRCPLDPQRRKPTQEQRGAGSDDRSPALLDVGIPEVEACALHLRIGMVDGTEGENSITFHAPVGRDPPSIPRSAAVRTDQGSECRPMGPWAHQTHDMSLWDPVVDERLMHPQYNAVRVSPAYYPARQAMDEVFAAWIDADRHFVREFQTAGFDARTWELYLRAALVSVGLDVDSVGQRPDFRCVCPGQTFFIEATTSNPSVRPAPPRDFQEYLSRVANSTVDYDEIAVRFGSALFTKQQKKYHELPHVEGHALAFAIEGFHDEGSLFHADGPLLRYLFGLDLVKRLAPGVAIPRSGRITRHAGASKTIASGWFSHPENKHVSAVLFSNSGTVPKFNRMGLRAGHAHPRLVSMMRCGFELHPDPMSLTPKWFVEEVQDVDELWTEGLVVIHNPEAAIPLDPGVLPGVSQVFAQGDEVVLVGAKRHVFTQLTSIVITRESSDPEPF